MQVAEAAVTAMEVSAAGGMLSVGTSEGKRMLMVSWQTALKAGLQRRRWSSAKPTSWGLALLSMPTLTQAQLLTLIPDPTRNRHATGEAVGIFTPGLSIVQRVKNAHMVFVTAAAVAPDGSALLTVRSAPRRQCLPPVPVLEHIRSMLLTPELAYLKVERFALPDHSAI